MVLSVDQPGDDFFHKDGAVFAPIGCALGISRLVGEPLALRYAQKQARHAFSHHDDAAAAVDFFPSREGLRGFPVLIELICERRSALDGATATIRDFSIRFDKFSSLRHRSAVMKIGG